MRRLGPALVVAVLACALGLGLGPAAAKKKGGKGKLAVRTLTSGPLNVAIPDDPDPVFSITGVLQTQIRAGKKFKGLRIDDVNAQLRVSHAEVNDLNAKLTAPNGATTNLVARGHTIGPAWGAGSADCRGTFLTSDDESPLFPSTDTTVTESELGSPYAGSMVPPYKPLNLMDGGPIRGTWTLTILDGTQNNVGTLNCWQIQVKPRRVAGLGGG